MTNLQLSDMELEQRFSVLVKTERKITREVLEMICEVARRGCHLERGYSNLYDWLVRGHGYSQSAANRRIQAARLLRDIPAVAAKIAEGSVNLTTLTQLQTILRIEEKRMGEKVPVLLKAEMLRQIEGKTSEETDRIVKNIFPENKQSTESLRSLGHERSKLTLVISEKDVEALKRVKELLSHTCQNWSAVVSYLARDYVKRRDPLMRKDFGEGPSRPALRN